MWLHVNLFELLPQKKVYNYKFRLGNKLRKTFIIVILSFLNYILNGVKSRPSIEQIRNFSDNWLNTGSNKVDNTFLYKKLNEAEILDARGFYFKSNNLLIEIMEHTYNVHSINHSSWRPKFLSNGFSHSIGHRALLGLLLEAQSIGLIPATQRTIFTDFSDSSDQLQVLFSKAENLEILKLKAGFRMLENPNFWHLTDRVKIIKTKNSFISDIELTEKVNSYRINSNLKPVLKLDNEYLDKCNSLIWGYGLPKDADFVALHLRDKRNQSSTDLRVASKENYEAAVKKILGKGYWIIQFGTDPAAKIIDHPRIIRIPLLDSMNIFLTPYIIQKSKFLLTTCSGPTHLAPLLETPVLQTNVIALGKNIVSLTKESIHLPKKWKINGSFMTLSQLLDSTVGYSDVGLNNMKKQGIEVIENSPREIYNATLDMLAMVESNITPHIPLILDQMRSSYKSPAKGNFAPSFLEEHKDWFLK